MMHLLRCACQCFVQFCSYIETLLWNIPLYSCIKLPPGPVLVTPVSFIGQMFALTHLKPGWRGQRSRCSHPYSGSQQSIPSSAACQAPSTQHLQSCGLENQHNSGTQYKYLIFTSKPMTFLPHPRYMLYYLQQFSQLLMSTSQLCRQHICTFTQHTCRASYFTTFFNIQLSHRDYRMLQVFNRQVCSSPPISHNFSLILWGQARPVSRTGKSRCTYGIYKYI